MVEKKDTPPDEVWKIIPWSDGYSVSSLGRFRADIKTSRNWGPGLRKPQELKSGHRYIRFLHNGVMRREFLHRVILSVFVGPPPSREHQCAHNDGDPSNNSIENLRWATPKENNADKERHGTYKQGSAVVASKLSESDVHYIRTTDLSGSVLAEKLGVSRRTIDRARSGEGWSHVKTPPYRRPQYGRHY